MLLCSLFFSFCPVGSELMGVALIFEPSSSEFLLGKLIKDPQALGPFIFSSSLSASLPISCSLTTFMNTSQSELFVMATSTISSSYSFFCRVQNMLETFYLGSTLNMRQPLYSLSSSEPGNYRSMKVRILSVLCLLRWFCSICCVSMNEFTDLRIFSSTSSFRQSSTRSPLSSRCNDSRSTRLRSSFTTLIDTRYPPPQTFLRVTCGATVLSTPLVMMPTLLQSASASSIMWVVMKIARFFWHLASTYHSWRRFSGSRPVEGSSRNTILGSPTRLIATDSLRFMPPDREELGNFRKDDSLTYSIELVTFFSISLVGMPLSLAQKQRCSSTVSCGHRRSNCGQTPIWSWAFSMLVLISQPPTQALPWLGSNMPVIIDIRVVLPAPLGPSSPKVSLDPTLRLKLFTAAYMVFMPYLQYSLRRLLITSGFYIVMFLVWTTSDRYFLEKLSSSFLLRQSLISWSSSSSASAWYSFLLILRLMNLLTMAKGNSALRVTPNYWGMISNRQAPSRKKNTKFTYNIVIYCFIQLGMLEILPKQRPSVQPVSIRQMMRGKANGANSRSPTGSSLGYWYTPMESVEAIMEVQMEMRQPMMLADLLLLRKVWKNTAMPICARDQPSKVTKMSIGEVSVKNRMPVSSQPINTKMIFVMRLSMKLKTKQTNQQLLIFIPFIFIIWISFSSFSSTTVYRNTGNSRLSDIGNTRLATKLMIVSMKLDPPSSSGMKKMPESTLAPVVCCTNAEVSQCVMVSRPVQAVYSGFLAVRFASLSLRQNVILDMPLSLIISSYRISFTFAQNCKCVPLRSVMLQVPSGMNYCQPSFLLMLRSCRASQVSRLYRILSMLDSLAGRKNGTSMSTTVVTLSVASRMGSGWNLTGNWLVWSMLPRTPVLSSPAPLLPSRASSQSFSQLYMTHCSLFLASLLVLSKYCQLLNLMGQSRGSNTAPTLSEPSVRLFITQVNTMQRMGVRIWQILVPFCLDCSFRFFRNSALNCCDYFWVPGSGSFRSLLEKDSLCYCSRVMDEQQ